MQKNGDAFSKSSSKQCTHKHTGHESGGGGGTMIFSYIRLLGCLALFFLFWFNILKFNIWGGGGHKKGIFLG